MMPYTRIRIVGSEDSCNEVLKALKERFDLESESYPRAPTRYTRKPKADYSIYVKIRGLKQE